MRLSKIKLAGFKSFVEPTTIDFPSSLVGVVGPNGCGKSNVIDAVRWVMGESSASRLRGDSITDVIFNGSSARKPVGSASVELLFDNSETTLEGQYAKYTEIAIRREVARDGVSSYYLNGTRCRRKDITGVFLGTGLGPRSYSIIEQGMISRLIEAKPEDMRVFLEEAAGISKYKERRRETSNRIKHTKENLDRLLDVLEEVEKQIKHLDRQAKTAERYAKYRAEERRTVAEVLALHIRGLDHQTQAAASELAKKNNGLEAAIAKQRRIAADIEQLRVKQSETGDEFNAIQGRYYKTNSEIARLEQSIEHARDLRQRQQHDIEQSRRGACEIVEHINRDETEIAELESSLNELMPGLAQAKASEAASTASLERAEAALAAWQETWDQYAARCSDARSQQKVEHTRSEQIESRLASDEERRYKLDHARDQANRGELQERFDELTAIEQRKRQARDRLERQLEDTVVQRRQLREQDKKLTPLAEERQAALQTAQARYASLEALQQATLGGGDDAVFQWLETHEFDANRRLAQSLDVDQGWECAVETVLGDYLQAVCLDDLQAAAASIAELTRGQLTLVSREAPARDVVEHALARKVSGAPDAVYSQLARVRVADTLQAALSLRERLVDDESVITPDGVWLGRNWLRVAREHDSKAGILSREHEMRRLKHEISELKARFESARKLIDDGRGRLGRLEEHREKLQADASVLLAEYSDIKADLDTARYRIEQTNTRRQAIAEESADLDRKMATAREQLRDSRQRQQQASESLAELEKRQESLSAQRDELRLELERVRQHANEDRRMVQDMSIEFESRRSNKESTAENLQRMQSQLAQFQAREREIREQLNASAAPLEESREQLQAHLTSRLVIEKEFNAVRGDIEGVEAELRELDQSRLKVEQTVSAARAAVAEAEMDQRELRVRREGFAEQLEHTEHALDELLRELDSTASVAAWEQRLARLQQRIDRLGPINLAAVDEFNEQTERKAYLDAQLKDLNEALATLEGAIRKIDRETRSRFRETYERVNSGFKRLFPQLFGGGHAYLELTGDDLLAAGVTVMARPPGKRNSTIHLLSGGEKVLAAVALVFAIFELNPAPFCMLDEVDAPLDDANIGRFCDIVKSMSDKVQFVFITHNKVTMEMARQLSGVTMQEPGVSRLVSVDLDAAVKMAAS